MKLFRCFVLAVFLILRPEVSSAQSAPFGLTWGMSAESVKAAGVDLQTFEAKDHGVAFLATKLSAALSDQAQTALWFGHDDKLWRIVAVSRSFENDPYGAAVKERYQELVEALGEKYGKGSAFHRLGSSIYKEPRYFLAGINGGETNWFTNFNAKEVDVQAAVIANSSSDGRWRIVFEHKDLKRNFEKSKKSKEKGAL